MLSLSIPGPGAVTYTAWFGTFAGSLVLYYVASTIYSWSRLRNVPGPFFAGISSLWEISTTLTGQEPWVYNDLAKKYGHLIRVSPNTILTDDPDVLRRMSGARGTYGKDGFYTGSLKHPDHDTMFSTMDMQIHDQIKAKLAGPYGGRETSAMEPIVDDMIRELHQHIRDEVSIGPGREHVVNFANVANFFTMDVITRISFGREMGFLRNHADVHGLMAALRYAMKTYTIPMNIPWLRSITTSNYFLKTLGPKSTDKEGPGTTMR